MIAFENQKISKKLSELIYKLDFIKTHHKHYIRQKCFLTMYAMYLHLHYSLRLSTNSLRSIEKVKGQKHTTRVLNHVVFVYAACAQFALCMCKWQSDFLLPRGGRRCWRRARPSQCVRFNDKVSL